MCFAACGLLALLTLTLRAAPAPPSNLTFQVSGDVVLLSWSPPAGAVLGYRVQAGSGAGLSNVADVVVGPVPQVSATAVPAGTYYVRVRAIDATGTSAPSNEVVVVVARPSAPAAPTGLTAQVSGSTISLVWTAPPGPVIGYRLEARSAFGMAPVTTLDVGSATQLTVPSVPHGVYFVRVRAFNNAGSSPPSSEALIIVGTPPCPVPEAPAAPTAAITSTGLTLSWQPLTLAGVRYVIEAGSQPGSSDLGAFPVGTATAMTTPVASGKYYVRVRGIGVCGLSGPASAETVVVAGGQAAPVANAGPDQTVNGSTLVWLNGSASIDPDGASLTFRWTLLSRPPGSAAQLIQAGNSGPSFIADRVGSYTVQLIVNDGQFDSAADLVSIIRAATGAPPVANAGPDQTVTAFTPVQLDGSGSSDPDGDFLTFAWTVVSFPAGSLSPSWSASTPAPSFIPVRAGIYVINLVVSDGQTTSVADTVTVAVRLRVSGEPLVYALKDSGNILRLKVHGGDDNYTGSLDAGTMPPGLVFTACHLQLPDGCLDLTGIPTQVGIFPITVRVTDGLGEWGTLAFSIQVTTRPVVVTGGLPAGEKNVAYTAALQASGGDGVNYTWSIRFGALPPGLTLDAAGVISGIPTAGGAFDVEFQVLSGGNFGGRTISLAIAHGPVPPTSSIMVLSARNFSCQVRNSELACWGSEPVLGTPQPIVFPAPPPAGAVPLRAIFDNFCGITVTGGAVCWADYDTPPQLLPQSEDLIDLGGNNFDGPCGLSSTGSILCWSPLDAAPTPAGGTRAYAALAETGNRNHHNCALTAAGAAYCWGPNGQGELGDGTTNAATRDQPVAVTGGHAFASLATGQINTCGITTSGDLYCWGSNENGVLGVGEGVEMSTVPLHVMPGTTFKPGSAMSHSRLNCAVATTGRAYCWGNVGIAGAISLRGWTPQPLPGDVNFAIVRANHRRLCGIDVEGASWCVWEGPLGNGSTLPQLVPARVLVAPP